MIITVLVGSIVLIRSWCHRGAPDTQGKYGPKEALSEYKILSREVLEMVYLHMCL